MFSFFVFPHLKNDGVKLLTHPPDCPVLLGPIQSLVEVMVYKDLLHLLESDASLGIYS